MSNGFELPLAAMMRSVCFDNPSGKVILYCAVIAGNLKNTFNFSTRGEVGEMRKEKTITNN
jgi:hypothetical protein